MGWDTMALIIIGLEHTNKTGTLWDGTNGTDTNRTVTLWDWSTV